MEIFIRMFVLGQTNKQPKAPPQRFLRLTYFTMLNAHPPSNLYFFNRTEQFCSVHIQ
jgi:hypothetical protein